MTWYSAAQPSQLLGRGRDEHDLVNDDGPEQARGAHHQIVLTGIVLEVEGAFADAALVNDFLQRAAADRAVHGEMEHAVGLTRLGTRRPANAELAGVADESDGVIAAAFPCADLLQECRSARVEASWIDDSQPRGRLKSRPQTYHHKFRRVISTEINDSLSAHEVERCIVLIQEAPPPFERTTSGSRSVLRCRRAGGASRVRCRAHAAETW